jgi:hypothetical protein
MAAAQFYRERMLKRFEGRTNDDIQLQLYANMPNISLA